MEYGKINLPISNLLTIFVAQLDNIMNNIDVNKLTEDQLFKLMYDLCRSGRVIIPQYFTQHHIAASVSKEDMLNIQDQFEYDDDLIDLINEKMLLHSGQLNYED